MNLPPILPLPSLDGPSADLPAGVPAANTPAHAFLELLAQLFAPAPVKTPAPVQAPAAGEDASAESEAPAEGDTAAGQVVGEQVVDERPAGQTAGLEPTQPLSPDPAAPASEWNSAPEQGRVERPRARQAPTRSVPATPATPATPASPGAGPGGRAEPATPAVPAAPAGQPIGGVVRDQDPGVTSQHEGASGPGRRAAALAPDTQPAPARRAAASRANWDTMVAVTAPADQPEVEPAPELAEPVSAPPPGGPVIVAELGSYVTTLMARQPTGTPFQANPSAGPDPEPGARHSAPPAGPTPASRLRTPVSTTPEQSSRREGCAMLRAVHLLFEGIAAARQDGTGAAPPSPPTGEPFVAGRRSGADLAAVPAARVVGNLALKQSLALETSSSLPAELAAIGPRAASVVEPSMTRAGERPGKAPRGNAGREPALEARVVELRVSPGAPEPKPPAAPPQVSRRTPDPDAAGIRRFRHPEPASTPAPIVEGSAAGPRLPNSMAGASSVALAGESHAAEAAAPLREFEPAPAAPPASQVTLQLDGDASADPTRIRVAVRGATVRAPVLANQEDSGALRGRVMELQRTLEDRGFTDARVTLHGRTEPAAVAVQAAAAPETGKPRELTEPGGRDQGRHDTGREQHSRRNDQDGRPRPDRRHHDEEA